MALLHTRDILGTYLADLWDLIQTDDLTYADIAQVFEDIDQELNAGRYSRLIRGNFDMRDIGYVRVGPQLRPLGRTAIPHRSGRWCRVSAIRTDRRSHDFPFAPSMYPEYDPVVLYGFRCLNTGDVGGSA